MKALLATKNDELARNLEAELSASGHDLVHTVNHAGSLGQAAERYRPDILLMDAAILTDHPDLFVSREAAGNPTAAVVLIVQRGTSEPSDNPGTLWPHAVLPVPARAEALVCAMETARWRASAEAEISRGTPDVQNRIERDKCRMEGVPGLVEDFLHDAPIGVIRTTPGGKILMANAEVARMLGYSDPETLMSEVDDIATALYTDPETRSKLIRELDRKDVLKNREVIMKRRDGGPIWMSLHLTALRDNAGRLVEIRGFTTDITEKKKAQEDIRRNEEKFRAVYYNAPFPAYIWKRENGRLYLMDYNQAADEQTEGRLEEFRALDASEFFEGRPEIAQDMETCVSTGETCTRQLEYTMRTTGRTVDLELTTSFVPPDMVLMFAVDVTEQKRNEEELRESQERFRRLSEVTDEGVLVHDSGIVVDANHRFCEMFACSIEQMTGRNFVDELIAPDHRDKLRAHMGTNTEKPIEVLARGLEGKQLWVSYRQRVLPYVGEDRNVATLMDVSEARDNENARRRLEGQLRTAQKMEAIGTLAGGIAHDFNNILYLMVGYTEMAQSELPSDSPQHKHLLEVLNAAERARELVRQILTISQQSEDRPRRTAVQDVAHDVVKLLKTTLPANIRVESRLDEDCGSVWADPEQVRQVLMNLCTNAYQAMPHGGRLSVSLAMVSLDDRREGGLAPGGAGKYVAMAVEDTGSGMSPDVVEKIFDPYFTTRTTGEGAGLGLAMARAIVRKYEGDIEVSSRPGKGSRFTVYLPEAEEACTPTGLTTTQREKRVLFVDDEPQLVRMLTQMLTLMGYDVEGFESPVNAAQAFEKAPDRFDLVMTDMTMPDMSGMELAARVRELRPDVPMILCTGYHDMVNESSARKAGFDSLLIKPVTRTLLQRTLDEALNGS